jgi:dihydrofolate reductase
MPRLGHATTSFTGTDTGEAENWAAGVAQFAAPLVSISPPDQDRSGPTTYGVMSNEGEPDMGQVIVSENVSLDGVFQDPTGEEGFRLGGWFRQMDPADREVWEKVELEEALAADALLLGGRSYQWFATRWVAREGAWAERLRELPKYVVRSTKGRTDWGATAELAGDVLAEVTALKEAVGGDIVVYASGQLVRFLLDHDLVDELRLTVLPVVLGSGDRIFTDLTDRTTLRLTSVGTIGDGLAKLVYRTVSTDS